MRLENPHRPLLAVNCRSSLPLVAVLFPLFPHPGSGLVVVLPDTLIELTCKPPYDRLVARIGKAQAAARQSPKVFVGRNNDD